MSDKPDRRIAQEFRNQPFGHHSPELQRVLYKFRSHPMEGKYVFLEIEPHKRWTIGQLTGVRGESVKPVSEIVYTSIEDAEWEVFKRRWQFYFEESLDDID